MTEEHLALYRQLSETKVYKERFGEWLTGDRYFCERTHESLTPKFIEEGYYDSVICDGKKYGKFVHPEPCCPDVAFWLPPVFDPENPGRCLVGMLNGAINLERMSGDWAVLSGSDGHGFYTHRVSDDRLDIALVKAILKQEGL